MGENLTIYFDDEALSFIKGIEGRGTLINQLIKEHFSSDIDILMRKEAAIESELKAVRDKLAFRRKELKEKRESSEEEKEAKRAKSRRKAFLEAFTEAWRQEKLSDEEYYSCFTKEQKFLESKAKGIYEKIQKQE